MNRVAIAKGIVHALALVPAAWIGWKIREVAQTGSGLGADPVAEIEHFLGLWALRFLMIALAITPLRQLTGQSVLVRFRRMLGLYAFFYACLHFSAFLVLDLRGYWTQIFEEIVKRPYITVGFAAWLLLVPLAITSTKGWIKRLGRNWVRLHKLVYAVGVLAVLHFWWLVKSDIREPALYAGILAVLLGWRLWKYVAGRRRNAALAVSPANRTAGSR
nr:protein-methionine-sulfoxide reductase heme-binding subunit MsrQ [Lysobacter lactosilyticus]